MHPAQLYRRSVLLPLDSLAVVRLEAGDVDDSVRVRRVPIGEALFRRHFTLLNDLNAACGTDLDDRATTAVDAGQLSRMVEFIRSRPPTTDPGLTEFRDAVRELAEEALRTRVPLFFVL